MMPPAPDPSQASAQASAGIERAPSTSAAISLSATALIQAEPNAIAMMVSATEATTHEALVSIEDEEDCSIQKGTRLASPFTGCTRFDHCTKLEAAPHMGIALCQSGAISADKPT